MAAPTNSVVCASNLQVAVAVVAGLGLPLHPQKCMGPATCIVVLGIELDTAAQIARLPADKFSALQEALSHWSTRKCCTKRDLQSLIGRLHHACMVVWPGRTFLRRMINLLSCFRNDSHPIRLNVEFRKDLAWWVEFFGQWNGISFFLFPSLEPLPDFSVSSDASGAIGYGAFLDNEWFNGRWSTLQFPLSIAYKELFPVVLAAHVWGPGWSRRRILFHVDNEAVVHILNSRTSPDPNIMHLLRSLLKAAACFSFTLIYFAAIHVPGRNNGIADALSCFNFQAFFTGHEDSNLHPSSALSPAFYSHLEARCHSFMYQGLASSTRHTYSCAQEKFVNFCIMTGHLSPYGSPCPASEWTLCLFATFLADSLRHSSI